MRKILSETIVKSVEKALIDMNHTLDSSLIARLKKAQAEENLPLAKSIIDDLLNNEAIAKEGVFPLCQDTGMVVVFAEIGLEVMVEGDIEAAINKGAANAYQDGYLRKSIVNHPFKRENTKTNTPVIYHERRVKGSKLHLKIAAKGAGSENMSRVYMLKPTVGEAGVIDAVVQTVVEAGGKACPPIIVGVGIGGNLEKSALLAKEALFRDLDDKNTDPSLAALETLLYQKINATGVGPMGVGGKTTCLAVKINTFPMHIASLPVAINIQCHASRHKEVVL